MWSIFLFCTLHFTSYFVSLIVLKTSICIPGRLSDGRWWLGCRFSPTHPFTLNTHSPSSIPPPPPPPIPHPWLPPDAHIRGNKSCLWCLSVGGMAFWYDSEPAIENADQLQGDVALKLVPVHTLSSKPEEWRLLQLSTIPPSSPLPGSQASPALFTFFVCTGWNEW